MKAEDIFDFLSESIPFKRRSSVDWLIPATIGVGIGVAAGVGLGMLIAPQSGMETRRQLRNRAEIMKDRARLAADRTKGELGKASRDVEAVGLGSTR